MTINSKGLEDAAAVRKRHWKFVVALIAVIAFCWLTAPREEKTVLPQIDVGGVRYISEWRPVAGEPIIEATFTITNTGPFAFSFSPWADAIRYDSGDGWATNDIGRSLKHSRSVINFSNQYFLLARGGVATGTAHIPASAKRWQVGYMVHVTGARKRLEDRLGTNWTKQATELVGDLFSENDGLAEIWGPVMEMSAQEKARVSSLQRTP